MSMIKTISYKVSFNSNGTIFSESIEFGAEIDTMPLNASQLEDAGKRINEVRGQALLLREGWDKKISIPVEVDKPALKLFTQVDGANILSAPDNTTNAAPFKKDTENLKTQFFSVSPEDAARSSLPAYDRNGLKWNYCPNHPEENINFVSGRTGKPYQACKKCKVFYAVDGKINPMDVKG